MFDLIITGGKVFDGTGSPWFWADLGIKDGKISAVVRTAPGRESPLSGRAPVHISATGKAICPGFIDIHSHSDFPLLVNPTADSKIMQGVTTEVIGQCGHSVAPVTDSSLPLARAALRGMPDIDWDWRSFGEYLGRLEKQGVSVNVVGLVGHGTVRMTVMGYAQRPPTAEEMENMKRFVRSAMDEGAFGMSTGLIYTPGSYSDTDELIELAKVVAQAGGLYFTHMRGEGEEIFTSLEEAIRIGRDAQLAVQVSHLKAYGLARGKGPDVLAVIENARNEGVDITADQYPYIASSTGLAALLPPWAHEGGREKLLERLGDSSARAAMKRDMCRRVPGWGNDFRGVPWSDVQIANCAERSYIGKRVQHIADEMSKDPWELVFDILKLDPGTSIVVFGIDEGDAKTIMGSEFVSVGSDGSALNPVGPLGQGQPHPRNYGTFPRVLGRYVREQRVLTLSQAIRKMTSAPANRLGLKQRGQVREGWWADLVIFDPDEIADKATFEAPHQFPQGISHVLVNGKVVVRDGEHTGVLAGEVIRKP